MSGHLARFTPKSLFGVSHYHVLAVLAVVGLAKDMVLERVVDLRSGRLDGQ